MLSRFYVFAGGLSGGIGAALSAWAEHSALHNSSIAATFLLLHAALFLVLGLAKTSTLLRVAGLIVLVGLLLFAGSLLTLDLTGNRLFPMSSPIGGALLIGGWLLIAVAGLLGRAND